MNPSTTYAAAFATTLLLAGCGAGSQEQPSAGSASGSSRQTLPAPVSLDDAERISSGIDSVASLHADGTVYAWGGNSYGQLGNGTRYRSSVPVKVAGLSSVQAIQAGGYHTVALRTDGTLWAWGLNNYGQLGNGKTNTGEAKPGLVQGLSAVKAVSAGYLHTAAVTGRGEVWGWGTIPGNASNTPVLVKGLSNVRTVAAGNDFTLTVKTDGSVWGWGGNSFGQLGNGSRRPTVPTPVKVEGLDNVVAVSAGYVHAIALRSDGSVWTWGTDNYEQLGAEGGKVHLAKAVKGLPTPTNGAAGVKTVAAGTYNSAVLYADGSVWIWGNNLSGQFGNGSTTSSSAPVKVNSITDVVALSIGDGFVSLLDKNGAVHSTGLNRAGQLGNNTLSPSTVPVKVVGLSGVGYLSLGKSTAR